MVPKTMLLAVALLAPLALSIKQDAAPKLTLSVLDSPKLTLSVVDNPKLTLSATDSVVDSSPKMALVKHVHNVDKHVHNVDKHVHNVVSISSIAAMEKVFDRSEAVHIQSMEEIAKNLTLPKAEDIMEHSEFKNTSSGRSELKKVMSLFGGDHHLRKTVDTGFGGLDGARRLLNEMILEAATKYDAEIAKCTDYYAKQCAIMEVARGQIAAANFMAASSRGLILDAQMNINKAENDIPKTKQELKDFNGNCANERKGLNKHLKRVMGDIAVMTMILQMTDCDKKLIQMEKLTMLRCEDECTKEESVSFNHGLLQKEVNELDPSTYQDLLASSFSEVFAGDEEADSMQFMQVKGSDYQELVQAPKKKLNPKDILKPPPKAVKAKFNKPPVPMTKVPANPCTDPNGGAPGAGAKRAAKCTLKKNPQCYKLQGRFLQIQAGIEDERDELMEQIDKLDSSCAETKKSLEASIENDGANLASSQTKLAEATQKESSAGEQGRQVAKENEQYTADLLKTMKTCTGNYVNFEQEICALKKIRGDLFKKQVKGHSGFFQDCELSKWTPEACSKKCAGGEQKLIRSVMQHPGGKGKEGAKCLPLAAKKKCNVGPCPIDCKVSIWSGWSKCSSKCGGGIQSRVRDVKVAMRYDGKPCSSTSETKVCNPQACEKDCELRKWTKWTKCSKDCDGGSKKRVRMVKEAAQGDGKCAEAWSKERLEYADCNMKSCKVPNAKEVMKCKQTLDIVLLMDGTPKSGAKGWAAQVKAANLFLDAFTGKANVAVIHYAGPRTWSGVSKCTGKGKKKIDVEKDCRVKIASHFSQDMKKVKGVVSGLQFTPGSKLLSLALMSTESELPLGRGNARSVVVVFMDGEPLSYRKTKMTARKIRKKARLVFVPVTKFAPLKALKTWVTRRWQENLVSVDSAEDWAKPETGTHIIANICPKGFPKLKAAAPKKR